MPENSLAPFIISIAALVAALAAVGVAVWQGAETRRHNRRSVKPHLTYYTFFSANHPCAGLELSNNGVGPAVITRFEVLVDGTLMPNDGARGWHRALEILSLEPGWALFHWLDPDDAIRVGESLWLLAIPEKHLNPERERLLRDAIPRLEVRVEYRSVYDEPATLIAAENTSSADRAG